MRKSGSFWHLIKPIKENPENEKLVSYLKIGLDYIVSIQTKNLFFNKQAIA